jgi:hypothetical protein
MSPTLALNCRPSLVQHHSPKAEVMPTLTGGAARCCGALFDRLLPFMTERPACRDRVGTFGIAVLEHLHDETLIVTCAATSRERKRVGVYQRRHPHRCDT